ncbi:MAG: 30S ribosomal protein S2 [Bacteriovoracaceae bacterium]|nr:30S ribosomal protein S2 [Bacteriovoracaceae bacterium]
MSDLEVKDLLAAGAHFGHQTHKWNPKMKKYVYGERNGIYIIDLQQTVPMAKKAYEFLKKTSQSGKSVLFVGTKRQAADMVKKTAEDCGAYHVTARWLGGMLTNYKTVAVSIDKLRKVEKMKENGDFKLLTKKEQSNIEKEVVKLERNLGGIKNMRKVPGAIVVIDPNNEHIAIKEAQCLGIPVVALTDTNCDPTGIDYVVPGNDDAIKSIQLFTQYFGNAVLEGGAKNRSETEDGVTDVSLEREILEKYEKDIDLKLGSDEE